MSTHMPPGRSAELQEAGWSRRFTTLGRRLEEAADLYRQLGFEVLLEPIDPDEEATAGVESCKHCFVTTNARIIYTRPRSMAGSDERLPVPTSNTVGASFPVEE